MTSDHMVTPTFGIDFKIKNIQLDGKRIKLQVRNLSNSCSCVIFWSLFSRFGTVMGVKTPGL
jgi:hypothetical protein